MTKAQKTYIVSYQPDKFCSFCTNLVIAECEEDIETMYKANYKGIKFLSIREAKDDEIESLEHRGCPIVECEHNEQEAKTMAKDIKYIVHYVCYGDQKLHTKTYKNFENAIVFLFERRNGLNNVFEDNGMRYSDGSHIDRDTLDWMLNGKCYIEKQVITSERLDY